MQATDDTAPIAKLEISADQGKSWTTIAANANAAIATLSQQGDVEVWARATDQAGNVSDVAKAGGKVDSAAPTVTAAADKEERTLTLTADDGTGSGVASIEYRIGTDGQWHRARRAPPCTTAPPIRPATCPLRRKPTFHPTLPCR